LDSALTGGPAAYIAAGPRPPAGPPALGDAPLPLALNESPFGSSPLAVAALARAGTVLNRYAWPAATALREAIGAAHGIPADLIVCGNGSEDVIDNIIRTYARAGDEIVGPKYTWAGFSHSARRQGVTVVEAPLRPDWTANMNAVLAAIGPRTRMVFLANPNNPLGTHVPAVDVARLVAGVPAHVVLCLDSAYAELATAADYTAGHEFVAGRPNVVVTRTLSKIYGLAGVRVGWAHASPGMVAVLDTMRQMSVIPRLAETVAMAALQDQAFVAEVRQRNAAVRSRLSSAMQELDLEVLPSQANFLAVRFPPALGKAKDVAMALLAKGIWTSQLTGYGLPDWLRITLPQEQDVERLIQAIGEELSKSRKSGPDQDSW